MKSLKVLPLLVTIVLLGAGLSALQVQITNDNADMVSAKKICMRLNFAADEAALYRDAFCISVDTADLELKGWRTPAKASLMYAAGFKKSKRLFTESLNIEVLIDFEKKDKQQQLAILQGAHLSASCFMLTKQGKNKVENVVIPLKVSPIVEDLMVTATHSMMPLTTAYTSTLLPYQKSFEFFSCNKQYAGKQELNELLIIDRLKELFRELRVKVAVWIYSFSLYKWYALVWLIFLLLLGRWFYPSFRFIVPLSGYWHRELFIMVSLLLFVFTWWAMRDYMVLYVWYGVLSALCVPCSLYFLWGGTTTVLDRLKILVGIIFAVALLPLGVLAYIYGNFDLFVRLLK